MMFWNWFESKQKLIERIEKYESKFGLVYQLERDQKELEKSREFIAFLKTQAGIDEIKKRAENDVEEWRQIRERMEKKEAELLEKEAELNRRIEEGEVFLRDAEQDRQLADLELQATRLACKAVLKSVTLRVGA
jgi:hypothetical protein